MNAKWTLMVYMAGNNSLSGAASSDLAEMQKVGSNERVKVLAFVKQENRPPRYVIVGKGGEDEVESLQEHTDSGDPQTVIDFVRWAVKKAPADRYALCLWNHGGGWVPLDLDQLYQHARGGKVERGYRREVNQLSKTALARVLFKKSAREVLEMDTAEERAICSDDVTGHSLDTIEVREVLELAVKHIGRPLDLFGMDACLMSTLEVAYETSRCASFVVGSEALEPGAGWSYDSILENLTASPGANGRELAEIIVKSYVDSYRGRPSQWPITQCALETARVEAVGAAVDALATSLCNSLPASLQALNMALARSTGFDFDMVDLRTFCRRLMASNIDARVKSAADAVVGVLKPGGCVVAEGHLGPKVEDCGGVSIYLPSPVSPRSQISPYYKDLAFAKRHTWADFLVAYFRAVKG